MLIDKYRDLINSGWTLTNEEVLRDVEKLFGGSFEAFCKKDSSEYAKRCCLLRIYMPAIDRSLSLSVYTCRRLIDLSLSLYIHAAD